MAKTAEVTVHVEDLKPNIILTMEDESGKRYLAAGVMDDLVPEDDPHGPTVAVESMKDRAFTLVKFSIVSRHG